MLIRDRDGGVIPNSALNARMLVDYDVRRR